jgi:hypothetical protein
MLPSPKPPTPSAAKRIASATPPLKQARQMYLDLGQKRFDSTQCKLCGMVFAPGVEELRHQRFCKKARCELLEWRPSKRDDLKQEFADGALYLVAEDSERAGKLRNLLDAELGEFRANRAAALTFAYVISNLLVGCVVTESIRAAHRTTGNLLDKKQLFPAKMGVLKVWVHADYRRRRVAARLVDVARAHYSYPAPIPKSLVAFSQPTPFGSLFARAYFASDSVLVYGPEHRLVDGSGADV